MPRFAANLTTLFTELPILDRFAAAARAGFEGAEILFPYDIAVGELSRAAATAGLKMVMINTPPPNWAGGPRGFAAQPGLEDRFRRDFDRALRVAEALRTVHIHVMAGVAEGQDAHRVFVQNLKWAAARAPHASLTIEPLNPIDAPGYFLADFKLARRVIQQVGAPNLGLQLDAYHAQIITGDVMRAWTEFAPLVRHVQVAGWPGRHEPDNGQINYPAFFAALDADGYRGWVSAEYNPAKQTEAGLDWLPVPALR